MRKETKHTSDNVLASRKGLQNKRTQNLSRKEMLPHSLKNSLQLLLKAFDLTSHCCTIIGSGQLYLEL